MSSLFYVNYELALTKLTQFCNQYDGSEIQRAGIIQAFEFTFEQCWKAIQKKAGSEGVVIASPKKAFEWAFQNGWIGADKENIWLEILSDRNLTSHTYRTAMAESVAKHVIEIYLSEFQALLQKMKL
jgi:nucleotidyltransferase substrate binding protein (TIGR01987 family)